MLWAAVPETTIHEHREFEFQKNKVWLSKNLLIPPPAADAMSPHQHRQRQFRVLVPTPANPRRDLGTLSFGKDISHRHELHG
jgi:hypothetical protein